MTNLGEAITFANGKPWRILGIIGPARSSQAPDIPTFQEAGYTVLGGSMRGLAAPRGIPADAMEQLTRAVDECNRDDTYLTRARNTTTSRCATSSATNTSRTCKPWTANCASCGPSTRGSNSAAPSPLPTPTPCE